MEHDIRTTFLAQLVATPAGRRHMLSISVDAEEGDEGGLFDQLADFVDDPKLRSIVERHRDDESRHAQLFRGCLSRLGLEMQPVPDELKLIRQIADATGGAERGVHTADDVVATYAMLLAIEERGVEQFPHIADAFRSVDTDTAEVYLRVARENADTCGTARRSVATTLPTSSPGGKPSPSPGRSRRPRSRTSASRTSPTAPNGGGCSSTTSSLPHFPRPGDDGAYFNPTRNSTAAAAGAKDPAIPELT
jgi:rubrerythrin